jgi:hypothetical protein
MDSPPPAPLPPQAPDRGMGCFVKGCLTLIITAVALVIICLCGGWFVLTRFADKFTATQPAVVEVRQPTPAEAQAAEVKWEGLRTAIRNHQETTVEFTADDLNALIATHPDFRKARGRLRIGITDSIVSLDLSAPLDSLKWTRLRGRWFNGNIRFGMSYVDDDFFFDLKSAEANGRQIPSFIFSSDLERSFSRSFSQSFHRRSESRSDRDPWLKHIRTISVQDDKIILTTRPI